MFESWLQSGCFIFIRMCVAACLAPSTQQPYLCVKQPCASRQNWPICVAIVSNTHDENL